MKTLAALFMILVSLQATAKRNDVNAQDEHGINALMRAVATGEKSTVQSLLKQKPNLELRNDADDTALAMAIGNDQDDIAVLLMKAGAKMDVICGDKKSSMIFLAASVNSKKALEYLLQKSPGQINTQNKNGDTALHEAARYGTAQTMTALLMAGAKKDIKNHDGKTPLEIAKSQKNEEATQLLAK
jgi:ankyrin repeat protein